MSDLEKLISALAAAEGQLPDVVTDSIVVTAQAHGVAKLLHDLDHQEGRRRLPRPISQLLLDIARQETAVELARMLGIRQVLQCLHQAEIPVLLLKGSALAYWLYENPAQRPRCDLDILVSDVASAKQAIAALQNAGYTSAIEASESSAEFETTLEGLLPGGFLQYVDLHWKLVNNAKLSNGLVFSDLNAAAVVIPSIGCRARGLCISDALLHALLHRMTNMPSGQHNRLIWLYDIQLLALRCHELEWRALLRQTARLNCATPCLDGLRAAREVFNTSVPGWVERTMEEQSREESWQLGHWLDQGAMDRAHIAALSWPGKFGWLRRKLFPSRNFMNYRYGADGTVRLMKAYVGRWLTGLRRACGLTR